MFLSLSLSDSVFFYLSLLKHISLPSQYLFLSLSLKAYSQALFFLILFLSPPSISLYIYLFFFLSIYLFLSPPCSSLALKFQTLVAGPFRGLVYNTAVQRACNCKMVYSGGPSILNFDYKMYKMFYSTGSNIILILKDNLVPF